MSDTSSDDILDGLAEDVEENLNESDADEEVDVDEDILEALEGGLAEQASDADDVMSHRIVQTARGLTWNGSTGFRQRLGRFRRRIRV